MKKNKAFTMFEISLVFAIVTVIVAVSIRITKAKFDSINRYLYFAAHSILQDSVRTVYMDMQTSGKSQFEKAGGTAYTNLPGEVGSVKSLYKMCKAMAYFVNNNSEKCGDNSTDNIDVNLTNFKPVTPDILVTNGMKLYNLNFGYKKIDDTDIVQYEPIDLPFSVYKSDGTIEKIDGVEQPAKGYVIYIDIDGSRGSSKLWDDIYPFYIVANRGMVVPAWKNDFSSTQVSGNHGAKDDELIKAGIYDNVKNEYITHNNELKRGITYQQAICEAGIIKGDYCESYSVIDVCDKSSENSKDCIVKIAEPVKM
ncbi:hypothetical protein IJF81_01520 [bacterium]|nr:hypothetical protein [bacterium]